MSEHVKPGQPIPVPDNFPVDWENPGDAKRAWKTDSHATGPLAPLSSSVGKAIIVGGFNAAFPQLGLPIQFRAISINGYPYSTAIPTAAPPEAVMRTVGAVNRIAPGLVRLITGRMSAEMTKQQLDKLNPILARFDAYWEEDLLPEINRHFAYFESCDLRGLSQSQLRAHFAESLKRAEKLGELHALAGFPALSAMSMFEELYKELFPDASPLDALRLLQGFDNQTLDGDRQLWRLSRTALGVPSVRQIMTTTPSSEVISTLETFAEGRDFLKGFRTYLKGYGQRLNAFGQLSEPSWLEDPTTAVELLKNYLAQPEADPEAERSWLASEREKAVSEARARLTGYPQPVVTRFETLLKAAQAGVRIKEDNHWVIERLFYNIRRVALEFGQRLAEGGVLADAGDVFFLTSEELLDLGALLESYGIGALNESPNMPGDKSPIQEKIQGRKTKRDRFTKISPPPVLGTMPHFVPDDSSPFSKAVKKADGARRAGSEGDIHGLHGLPASAGVVRGPARVIYTLADASKLQPGDVLVAPSTMPPWTPLFGIAAGVVTDSGGVLSHSAVVAREYRIPAVVGTGKATKIFQDGHLLEVDGDSGIVRVFNAQETP